MRLAARSNFRILHAGREYRFLNGRAIGLQSGGVCRAGNLHGWCGLGTK